MTKTIAIIAIGTRGDVQPAIALGKRLRGSGYHVRLIASSHFRVWIEAHGLEAAATNVDIQAMMRSAGGQAWVEQGSNPMAEMRQLKKLIEEVGVEMARDSWAGCAGAAAVISSFTSDTMATAIAEKLNIPHISMPLQPTLLASRDGRVVLNAPLPQRISLINYWFSKLLIEPYAWRMWGGMTAALREQIGLPPQTARQNLAARRRMLILHAYSRHVVPHPQDWPPRVHTTGYWFLDEEAGWQPPAELLAFLADGPPPVYIGFGSMTGRDPAAITQLLGEAVTQSGQRAILLSGWAGMGSIDLPATIFTLENAPHSWLFPRMAVVVHHGGAGTTAAGLRAGVPTIIVPHMADQPFWGLRVAALGVGPAAIPRPKLTAVNLAQAIKTAVSNEEMQRNASALGEKIRAEDGVSTAVSLIQQQLATAGVV